MRILLYNVMMLPSISMSNGQMERVKHIVDCILKEQPYDAIVFLEMFHSEAREYTLKALKDLYPQQCRLRRAALRVVCGGVVIVSRYSISKCGYAFYKDAKGADQLASKGFLRARIDMPNGPVNLVATHVQAWDVHEETRRRQFAQLNAWVRDKVEPGEPVVVLGDLNYDYHVQRALFHEAVGRDAQVAERVGPHLYGSDGDHNELRGSDGTAEEMGMGDEYYCQVCHSTDDGGLCRMVCKEPARPIEKVSCTTCTKRLLDYAFIPEGRPKASEFSVRIMHWKAARSMKFPLWRIGWVSTPSFKTRDLSDHFPVEIIWSK